MDFGVNPEHMSDMKKASAMTRMMTTAPARRRKAIEGARAVLRMFEEKGISAVVIGSLATGEFGPDSDIDFLLTECPRKFKYAIESRVEDILDGFPFDVIYLDEIPAHRVSKFISEAVDASNLR
jgi:predicted nucleotidyltransferase